MLDKVIELQTKAVDELEYEFNSEKREITFKSPTGSGKTFITARFMDTILSKDSNIVFIVSSLSKAKLAEQNNSKFKEYVDHGYVKNIKPFLISSEDVVEGALYIPTTDNVYSLPRDLYKEKSKLKGQRAFLKFIKELESSGKRIVLIKDEAHIATKNLDELRDHFYKILNISATTKTKPDVEITEEEAVNAGLINRVVYKNSDTFYDDFYENSIQYDELKNALHEFIKIKPAYYKHNINPCFIIQISNTEKGENQFVAIMKLLGDNDFKDLKYVSMTDNPKLCKTNDQLIKTSPNKWEKYVVQNDSLIDIIIFKMKVTEGWDIPRACMLFQIRDSQSKQLDIQVLGRIRRNPLLTNFEELCAEDKQLMTTSYAWAMKNEGKDNHSVQVKLKGDEPFEIANVRNQIQEEIKVLTTRIKDLTKIKSSFDIEKYLNEAESPLAAKDIFSLYSDYLKSTNDVQQSCKEYCSNKSDHYSSWFRFNNHLSEIKAKSKAVLSDYASSMEIVSDTDGHNIQYTIPFDSLYFSSTDFPLTINNWIWNSENSLDNFSFDSSAEQAWIHLMLKEFKVKTIKVGEQDIKMLGKNFLVNSNIKYQYYANGIHDSYPDFIMKDAYNRYFLFEVKSMNTSKKQNMDTAGYEEKIKIMKNLYKEVSKLLKYYFCLPVQKGKAWNIWVYKDGNEKEIDFDSLCKIINNP